MRHITNHLIYCILFGLANFSNASRRNLTEVTWAHAVNDAEYLSAVLKGDINFIEADILMGHLKSDSNNQHELPIMAHPPATESDLSLESFLQQVLSFNTLADESKVKGVKLDFKSIEAFEKSVVIIQKTYSMETFPTWINADILPGPVNNTENTPVNATRFFQSAKKLGPAVLSIGWTTKWGKNADEGQYSSANVDQMLQVIRENDIDKAGCAITFPIRAGIAANSLNQLIKLYCALKDTNVVTYTIWSSANDAVNVDKLRKFIFTLGLDKVYVDVPEELKRKLHLNETSYTTGNELNVRCSSETNKV